MATIWRLPTAVHESGKSRSAIYEDIKRGLWTVPVKIGARAAGWPADEVRAINAARIAGKTQLEIQALVKRLEEARKGAFEHEGA